MMIIIIVFSLLFFKLLGSKIDTLSFVTLLVLYSYWFVQLILSQFRIDGIYLPSMESTLYLLVGVICFTLGYYGVNINTSIVSNYRLNVVQSLKASVNNLLDKKEFQFVLVLISIYVVSLDVYFFNEIVAGAFIRTEGISMAEYYGPTFAKMSTYLFSWYIPLLRPLFCYCLLHRRKWYLPFMAILLLGFEILNGGRIGLIRTFIPLLLIWGLFSIQKIVHFKFKKIIFFVLLISGVYFGIVALTAFRLGTTDYGSILIEGQEHSNDAIITYLVGPSVAFDQVIHSNIIDMTGGYKYGLNVLWPLFFPLLVIMYLLGGTDYINGPAGAVSNYLQFHYLSIAPGSKWNALYTWNVDFFCDAGLIGIIFFNFLFGYLMRCCFKWLYKKATVYNLIIVSILFVIVMQAPIKLYGFFNLLPFLLYILFAAHYSEAKKLYSYKLKK